MCPGCRKKIEVFLNSGLDCCLGKEQSVYKCTSVCRTSLAEQPGSVFPQTLPPVTLENESNSVVFTFR